MHRRRRAPNNTIHFSFDSFLDVVANVNGIIIRLILVAFVGARAYDSSMKYDPEPIPNDVAVVDAIQKPAPKIDDDPLKAVLDQQRRNLLQLRAELAKKAIKADETLTETQKINDQLEAFSQLKERLAKETAEIADAADKEVKATETVALSLEELNRRGKALKDAIAQVEAIGPPRKELRYHTPVSKTVTSDELFFECKNGRVTYLDLPGLMRDIEERMKEREDQLRDRFSVEDVTQPSGAFRARYTIVRRKSGAESLGGSMVPGNRLYFAYGLGKFVIEPIADHRGETLAQALKASSEFRQTVDLLDSQTVVTFWVYPDSFALFRALRDYLYERGVEVAARPLPEGEPIAGSPTGSRSRGQ